MSQPGKPAYPRYIIQHGKIVEEPDLIAWERWYEQEENRRFAETTVYATDAGSDEAIRVVTMFLGAGKLLFETMIHGGKYNEQSSYAATIEEAQQVHLDAVNLAKTASPWEKVQYPVTGDLRTTD